MLQNTHPSSPRGQIPHASEPDIRGLLIKYLKFWPFILFSMVFGVLAAYLYNRNSIPIYQVKSTILVSSESSPLAGMEIFETGGLMSNSNTLKINNEVGILKSYSIAKETIESLDQQVRYYKEGLIQRRQVHGEEILVLVDWDHPQLVGGELIIEVIDDLSFELSVAEGEVFRLYQPMTPFEERIRVNGNILPVKEHRFGDWIEGQNFKFKVNKLRAGPGEEIFVSFHDSHSLALSMRNRLKVEPLDKETSILQLSLETPIKKLGEDYLNALMKTYQARELAEKNRTSENTIKFIGEQLKGITDSLSFFENSLQEYRSNNRVFDLSTKGTAIFNNLEELERQVRETELQIQYYENLKAYISMDKLDSLTVPSVVGIGDPLLNALVVDLVRLQGERTSLSSALRQEITPLRELIRKIEHAKRTILENVESASSNLKHLLVEFRKSIRAVEGEINQLPETERKLLGIQRQFSINENIYLYLLQKQAEAEISKAANTPSHQILDRALSDGAAISPQTSRNLVIGLMLGLFLPIGLITLWSAFNNKISDIKEVERMLDVPLIGTIPRHAENEKKVVFDKPKSGITESFRSIRANMAYLHPAKSKITFLFTSTFSGEGKTFCSVNMASVYALTGKKTILVGLDLRKPKIGEIFGLSNDVGLSTCLSSDRCWRDLVKPSGHEYLDILQSGPIPPNPAELLMQDKSLRIMAEIKNEYDVVVLDSSPLGLVSETMDLLNLADVKVFILRQDYSDYSCIETVNNLKGKNKVDKLYALVNDVQKNNNYGYGYRYAYGYNGYGYYEEEKQKAWWKWS